MLEATMTRKAIYEACKTHDDTCTGCPYRYSCETFFPYVGRDIGANDFIPADYVLSDDGATFFVKGA